VTKGFHQVTAVDEVIQQIATDYRKRLLAGGTEPPDHGLRWVRLHRLGAVRLPVALGGAGYGVEEFFDFLIALAAADPDLAHILRVHYAITEDLQRVPAQPGAQRWLQVAAAGELIGGASSELSSHQIGGLAYDTALVATADGLRLRGRKFYSTGAQFSDHLRITAHDDEGAPVSVIIPVDRHGVVHADDWDGVGQRHTGSGTTILGDVAVAEDEVVRFGTAVGVDRRRGAQLQLYLHAIAAGILRALAADAVEVVRSRQRSYTFATTERPADDPQLLEVVGQIDAVAYAAQALVQAAARELAPAAEAARTTGIDPELEVRASVAAARVKVALEGPALQAATRIFDVGGASSTRASAHLDRHWRNLRTLFSHNPTVYKARVLGDIAVNDAALPDSSFF
jgi:alkylation response protein AidB-like acyl-CoA dehydrogenase